MARTPVTTSTATLAVAADYADALITARRAKNLLFLLLLLFLLAQIAVFLLLRYDVLRLDQEAGVTATATTVTTSTTNPTTEPSTATGTAAAPTGRSLSGTVPVAEILRYAIPVVDFLGVTLVIVLCVVLLLLTTIMLVGRLVGVSHVTSAFIWCVLLTVFLFPWQAFLITRDDYRTTAARTDTARTDSAYPEASYSARDETDDTDGRPVPPQPAFKMPGVLYTYAELRQDYKFENGKYPEAILKWARYVGFPFLAIIILFMVNTKSGRGLKYALGESEVHVDVATR